MKRSYGWQNQEPWLKLLAIILIGVAAGPEIGLAMEMTTLLEILGAAIFFLSFRVGAKMLLIDLSASARNFVCPPVVSAMGRPGAVVYVSTRVFWLVVMVLIPGRFCLELTRGGLM